MDSLVPRLLEVVMRTGSPAECSTKPYLRARRFVGSLAEVKESLPAVAQKMPDAGSRLGQPLRQAFAGKPRSQGLPTGIAYSDIVLSRSGIVSSSCLL